MSTVSGKKRGGDESNEIPPKKMAPEVLEVRDSAKYDVVIIVEGQKFQCRKKELSHHSTYFRRMFDSNFEEKNKKEVELGWTVELESFDLFLKMVYGENIINDVTVETMLELADYLESTTLEENCIRHLSNQTAFSLRKQFELAETYHSEKLMIQVLSSVKDADELDDVMPKDLGSVCNTTRNIIMQKSFELLGIRKPVSPPLPKDSNQLFEHMMGEMIDQAEVQNHHGEVLYNQSRLLLNQVGMEHFLQRTAAGDIFRGDPLIMELSDQQRDMHGQDKKNFILAQVQVLKFKHIYTYERNRLHDLPHPSLLSELRFLSTLLNIDEQSRSQSQKVLLGNRGIDEIYRKINADTMEKNQAERPRNVSERATWLQGIDTLNDTVVDFCRRQQNRITRPMPAGIRQLSNNATFRTINELVSNSRNFHYGVFPWDNREHVEEVNEEGPDQGVDHQIQEDLVRN